MESQLQAKLELRLFHDTVLLTRYDHCDRSQSKVTQKITHTLDKKHEDLLHTEEYQDYTQQCQVGAQVEAMLVCKTRSNRNTDTQSNDGTGLLASGEQSVNVITTHTGRIELKHGVYAFVISCFCDYVCVCVCLR